MEDKEIDIFEKEIFLGRYEGDPEEVLIKYFLSNKGDKIEDMVNRKIINNIQKLNEMKWKDNTKGLAQKVKDMMIKHDVVYSMTIRPDRENRAVDHVVINWHSNNKWLFSGGVIIAKEFYTYAEVGAD